MNPRQKSIALIAAFTATGQLPQLREALAEGLGAGLTISEINEILVQLYAYAGFPRSLNAIGTFMAVVADGGPYPVGEPPSPLPANSLEAGTRNQTALVGSPVAGPLYEFAPAIDQFLKAHLFGDIFGRDNLDWASRELATVAALASLDGLEPQLRSHFRVALHNGVTPADLRELVALVGSPAGDLLAEVLAAAVPD